MTDPAKGLLPDSFTITEAQLNTGLRGFPVGSCRTSAVNAEHGVSYVGYPVADLAALPAEDVIYLLFYKQLPDAAAARTFRADLARRAEVAPEVFAVLRSLPRTAHPMEWFLVGLHALGMTGKSAANDVREDALNLVARVGTLAAAVFRLHGGWGEPISPPADRDLAAAFAHALGVPNAAPQLPELLRTFHVLHADHGGGNLSTFVGKAIASSQPDIYSAMSGAMAALYGPLHGRANQEALGFVREVRAATGDGDAAAASDFIRSCLADGRLIFGFGHAVLRAEDPRAAIQYAFGERHFADHPDVRMALLLRRVVPPLLGANPKIKNPYPNVDAISGALLAAAGLANPEYYTLLFGWSRVAGIAAQVVDERLVLRDGRGVPIYRPRYVAERQPPRRLP